MSLFKYLLITVGIMIPILLYSQKTFGQSVEQERVRPSELSPASNDLGVNTTQPNEQGQEEQERRIGVEPVEAWYGDAGVIDLGVAFGPSFENGFDTRIYTVISNFFVVQGLHLGMQLMFMDGPEEEMVFIYPNIGYSIPFHKYFNFDITLHCGGMLNVDGPHSFSLGGMGMLKFPILDHITLSAGLQINWLMQKPYPENLYYLFPISVTYYW